MCSDYFLRNIEPKPCALCVFIILFTSVESIEYLFSLSFRDIISFISERDFNTTVRINYIYFNYSSNLLNHLTAVCGMNA